MNERQLFRQSHPKAAIPLSARGSRSVGECQRPLSTQSGRSRPLSIDASLNVR
jgi:hypothetical protein